MPEATFQNSVLSNNSVGCPHCGQLHTWNKENAFLESPQDVNYRAGSEKEN